MDIDSEEEILLFQNVGVYHYVSRNCRKQREYCAHPINVKRYTFGEFHHLYSDLRKHPQKFFEYMRMSKETFDYILSKISANNVRKYCNCHSRPILEEERLMLTIRFLSTGQSFRSLAFSFRMGATTVSKIIRETVEIIFYKLQPIHIKMPTQQDYKNIAEQYNKIWNFPNCISTIDGKHIRIQCPNASGSMFYNYKQYFSIVLQGLVDANYRFINIDVGGYGKQSDGGIFRNSALYLHLIDGHLNIPPARELPKSTITLPYVMLGDEAYPLLENVLKPYNRQQLDSDKEYFNARLSRARRTVECAFGIINSKWRILGKPIESDVIVADHIVKAICVLHNVIIDMEGIEHHLKDITMFPKSQNLRTANSRSTFVAQHNRDVYKTYIKIQL